MPPKIVGIAPWPKADVGIALGAAGSDVAMEAAHLALLREDWSLVPAALRSARRTMGVVAMNIAFTALYNVVGLSLAAPASFRPSSLRQRNLWWKS